MSRGRLSDCSGSTTGKMEVRVLTHSQAVSSACERRESVACARKGSLRLLLCPGVRARARGKKKKTREARARGVVASSSVAVRTETVHGLRNDRGMPVFTPGSNPRRLPAAASRRESRFLSSSRRDGSRRRRRATWRGGEDTNAPFSSRSRPTRARGSIALATVVRYLLEREDGEAETVRRARGTEKTKKRKKKRPSRVYDDGAERVSRSSRSGQKRIIGCVMTEECPCSPREATLGASPRRHAAAGRAYVSIIPRRTRRAFRKTFRKTNCRCSFRGSSAFFPCGLRDPGEEHPLNVALSQNAPRLRVFYVRFCR